MSDLEHLGIERLKAASEMSLLPGQVDLFEEEDYE